MLARVVTYKPGDKEPDDDPAVKKIKTKRLVVVATMKEEGGECGGKGEKREARCC